MRSCSLIIPERNVFQNRFLSTLVIKSLTRCYQTAPLNLTEIKSSVLFTENKDR